VVREVERQDSRPDRKVYHITEDGRRALEDWFAEPPSPLRPRNELLLRIFLGRHARPEHLIRDVRTFGEGIQRSLSRLRTIRERIEAEEGSHPDQIYRELVLDYGLSAFEALAEWIAKPRTDSERWRGCRRRRVT
jgi:PadR family transcriptional regulator, regulatory protein AphA